MRAFFTFLEDSAAAYQINVFIIHYYLSLRYMHIYMHVIFSATISIFSDEKVGQIEMGFFYICIITFLLLQSPYF